MSSFRNFFDSNNEIKPIKGTKIGLYVESKIGMKKLISKINLEEGSIENIAKEFIDDGGQIVETNDNYFLIKVNSGSFYINRTYVKLI